MSKIPRRAKELKSFGCHEEFLKRIQKTLYYGKLPNTDRLSLPVTELASGLFSEPKTGRSIDRLHCKDAAYISREACVSPCSFVLAMVYLERLKACNPEYLQSVAPSQLFLVSLMVSSKFLFDNGADSEVVMNEWATTGGISVQELIDSEREFLNAIDWNIFVDEASFWNELSNMETKISREQGKERGFFTYTELNALMTSLEINVLVNYLATTLAVVVTTYMAGILTILGSMFLASNIPGSALKPSRVVLDMHVDTLSSAANVETNVSAAPPLDDLQTKIVLATIQQTSTQQTRIDTGDEKTTGLINGDSWDWWNNPAMTWLTQTSKLIENVSLIYASKITNHDFMDRSIAGCKKIALQDRSSKGVRVRLQDQLEHSWHTEWTDTLTTLFFYQPLSYYFQQIKA